MIFFCCWNVSLPEFLFLDMLCIKVEIQFVQIVDSSTEQQNRILVLSRVAHLDPDPGLLVGSGFCNEAESGFQNMVGTGMNTLVQNHSEIAVFIDYTLYLYNTKYQLNCLYAEKKVREKFGSIWIFFSMIGSSFFFFSKVVSGSGFFSRRSDPNPVFFSSKAPDQGKSYPGSATLVLSQFLWG